MKKIAIILALLGTFIYFTGCKKNDMATKAGTFYGNQATLGNGTVRSYITLDNEGNPASLGFNFTESMLSGLPATTGMNTMIMLDPPKEAAASGFKHMELDWNPNGHEPMPIYGFPHFDFHFFIVGMDELSGVAGGPDMTPVDAQFIPKDYSSGIMAVPNMGVHWTDSLSSEFHGIPFTHTFVYGFYKSKMLFVEPMISKAFLDSKTDITLPVKQPAAFQKQGYYPSNYQIHYDASKKEYNVSIENLSKH
ncbi:MAG: DUF5602 domain-containing protein [Ginsengibacter sp.]